MVDSCKTVFATARQNSPIIGLTIGPQSCSEQHSA